MRIGFLQNNRSVLRLALGLSIIASLALPGVASARGYQFKVLHSFCTTDDCSDGYSPFAGLVMDQSGSLYGTTAFGGVNQGGTVFELAPNAQKSKWKYKTIYNFCARPDCGDGREPFAGLIVDSSGNLYGTTSSHSTVFELVPNAERTKWKFKLLYAFCRHTGCPDGSRSYAGLTYAGASSGVPYDGSSPLYGTTSGGGLGAGTVFQLTPAPKKWTEKVLYSFCSLANCTDGDLPEAGLTIDAGGNLYGATTNGGQKGLSGSGMVFQLSPNADKTEWIETVLYSFCQFDFCPDGSNPGSSLLMDSMGNLFGLAAGGGTGHGVVFKIAPNGEASTETVVYNFCSVQDCADGSSPMGGLTMDASGNLFGNTYSGGGNDAEPGGEGGGTVFELNGKEQVLYSFCARTLCTDGEGPVGNVIADGAGNLFGTTTLGGRAKAEGVVYELIPR